MENSRTIILLILLSLITVFTSAQEITIRPNWKKGDARRVKTTSETVCLIGGDTLVNSSGSVVGSIKVEDVTKQGYIVSHAFESMGASDFSMPMLDTVDKAQAIFALFGGLMKAAEKVAKDLKVSYVIDPAGEAVSVANFDETFKDYSKATIIMMDEFMGVFKETFGDSIDIPIDSSKMNEAMGGMKDKLHEQLLNSVNYFNQAYWMTYDKTKQKTSRAIITDIDVIKYGTIQTEGNVITEVLSNTSNGFKVKITTEYDHASLKQAFDEQLGKDLDGLSSIEDWMIIEYEPTTLWIKKINEFQHIRMNEVEVKIVSTTVFQK